MQNLLFQRHAKNEEVVLTLKTSHDCDGAWDNVTVSQILFNCKVVEQFISTQPGKWF